jgi:hypothetical protein
MKQLRKDGEIPRFARDDESQKRSEARVESSLKVGGKAAASRRTPKAPASEGGRYTSKNPTKAKPSTTEDTEEKQN